MRPPELAWLKIRPVWVTLLLLALWGAYELRAVRSGERKLEGTPYAQGQARSGRAVPLDFPPEAFHMALLQEAGRLIRVEDRTAYLVDVPEPAARDLAQRYWVERIEPWTGS